MDAADAAEAADAEDPGSHALSFGTVAERYDRYRPGYAPAALAWALGERPLRVADLGAGTGILSRQLTRLGHEVLAIEPDDRMRARLTAVSPGVTALAGTAEDIPLADGSVDAVVAGQAYHWFDPARAHPEIARVLRPAGVFAALRNDPDPLVPWTVRFAELIDGPAGPLPEPDFGDRFEPVTVARFRHEAWATPDDLVASATTRSPYLVGTAWEQRDLVDAIRRLADGPELAGRDRFPVPMVTRVHRAIVRTG